MNSSMPKPKRLWRPLFPSNEKVWLDQELRKFTVSLLTNLPRKSLSQSVESGAGALSLYFSNLHLYRPHPQWAVLSRQFFKHSTSRPLEDVTLFSGGTGVFWLSHLMASSKKKIKPFRTVELKRWIARERQCDSTLGIAGAGLGLLQGSNKTAEEDLIIDQLFKRLHFDSSNRMFWPTAFRAGKKLSRRGPKYLDLGLAHGLPGTLLYLAYFNRRRPGKLTVDQIHKIEGMVAGLLDWNRAHTQKGFGFFADEPKDIQPRSAWCYGDPGVGFAVLQLGLSFKNDEWYAAGNKIALRGLSRSLRTSLVKNPYFCHGAIGLAHIAARTYQLTGDRRFKTQAARWYGISAKIYRKYSKVDDGDLSLTAHSLGYFHFAVAARLKRDPSWDSLFLLSLPGSKF
jgi:hypothetical protein